MAKSSCLDSSDESELDLEGAEDIDNYCLNEVSVTQVKHSGRPITLRSQEIIESINNFWELRKRNPHYDVRFRLLTIAEVTTERERPFVKPGLTYWEECKCSGAPIQPLRDFY